MAPSHSRQLLVWTTLPIAFLISYLWFRRKRTGTQSDPGRIKQPDQPEHKNLQVELEEAATSEKSVTSPVNRSFSRSLSGVESAPIDIIFPPDHKSAKNSSQIIISDEDLDLEIEKIKSMKNSFEPLNKRRDAGPSTCELKFSIKDEVKVESPIKKSSSPKVTPKKENCTKKVLKLNKSNSQNTPKQVGGVRTKTESYSKMAQKDIVDPASVEEKLSSLKIEATNENVKGPRDISSSNTDHEDLHRQSCERDSANHSPADVMLASPSLSSISDNHSEGSSDSGKGGSDVATPPSRTPAGDGSVSGDVTAPSIYEFVIPQTLVGKLIGRHGSFVSQIKEKTRAHILIKKHPESNKLKICAVEGTQLEIENALEMVRDKFPEKRYPELTLDQVSFLPLISTVPLIPEQLCLKLVEGINNDTIVSCMVAPNHLFLQQPGHPTFPNLNMLTNYMNLCYSDVNSPLLPNPIPENTVCVAQSLGAWYRAIVLSADTEADMSYVKFLDYGGYANVSSTDLRQIRADFLLLPFQAAECVLANIRPAGDENAVWSEEAYTVVADLTKGAIIYTQIAEYTEDAIPLVLIYVAVGPQQVVFLNEELVNRGYAEWLIPDIAEGVEGAVGGLIA